LTGRRARLRQASIAHCRAGWAALSPFRFMTPLASGQVLYSFASFDKAQEHDTRAQDRVVVADASLTTR
jgi:hypothetical protein